MDATRGFGPLRTEVSVVGQGTWHMESDARSAVAALRRGLDLGLGHVDTAEMYGSGRVEEIVGEAIRGRRGEVFLVSKVLPQNASHSGTKAACERSLKRLGTDFLDVYLLHWRGSHPLEGTIRAFEELKREGKIRAWGVSNFDASDLDEALAIAGAGQIACNQVLYHLEERGIEHRVIPWCGKHRVAVVAYSPFGSGSFPGARTKGGRVLDALAKEKGATPRQIALAFLARRKSTFVIPKAASAPHVEENAGARDVELSDEDVARIDAAFPLGKPPRELPTL